VAHEVIPSLSILIPSIPSRLDMAAAMIRDLDYQIGTRPVEVLCLTDNKRRSIGAKRQALLESSRGHFVCFVDDDDEIVEDYVARIMDTMGKAIREDADVIVFPTLAVLEDGRQYHVDHSIRNENEQPEWPHFKRKPWQVHPIRGRIARASVFTDCQYGEDADWLLPIWPQLRVEVSASQKPLYTYRRDTVESEAR